MLSRTTYRLIVLREQQPQYWTRCAAAEDTGAVIETAHQLAMRQIVRSVGFDEQSDRDDQARIFELPDRRSKRTTYLGLI